MNFENFKQKTLNVIKNSSSDLRRLKEDTDMYGFKNENGNYILELDSFGDYGYVDILYPSFLEVADNSFDKEIFMFNRKYKAVAVWKDSNDLWLSAHTIILREDDYNLEYHEEMMNLIMNVATDIHQRIMKLNT